MFNKDSNEQAAEKGHGWSRQNHHYHATGHIDQSSESSSHYDLS